MKYMVIVLFILIFHKSAFADEMRLSMNRVGPIWIGMNVGDVYKIFNKTYGKKVIYPNDSNFNSSCDYYNPFYEANGLSFMLNNGNVARIDIDFNVNYNDYKIKFITLSGIKIGDRVDKIKRKFGNIVEDIADHYDGPDIRNLIVKSSDKKYAIRFDVDKEKIIKIYSGLSSHIYLIEGCS
jgi:hypothetical protein